MTKAKKMKGKKKFNKTYYRKVFTGGERPDEDVDEIIECYFNDAPVEEAIEQMWDQFLYEKESYEERLRNEKSRSQNRGKFILAMADHLGSLLPETRL